MDCCNAFPKVLTEPCACMHHFPKGCHGIFVVLSKNFVPNMALHRDLRTFCTQSCLSSSLFPTTTLSQQEVSSTQCHTAACSILSSSFSHSHLSCHNGNGQTEASELSAEPFLVDTLRAALPLCSKQQPGPSAE